MRLMNISFHDPEDALDMFENLAICSAVSKIEIESPSASIQIGAQSKRNVSYGSCAVIKRKKWMVWRRATPRLLASNARRQRSERRAALSDFICSTKLQALTLELGSLRITLTGLHLHSLPIVSGLLSRDGSP